MKILRTLLLKFGDCKLVKCSLPSFIKACALTFSEGPQNLNVPKHWPCWNINCEVCDIPWGTSNIDCAKTSTALKHRSHQNIKHTKISTTPKHRPHQNINHTKISTTPKHRPRQNTDKYSQIMSIGLINTDGPDMVYCNGCLPYTWSIANLELCFIFCYHYQ